MAITHIVCLWNTSVCLFYTAWSVWCLIIDQGPPLISIILSLWRSGKFGSCLHECGSRLNQGPVSPELNQNVSLAAGGVGWIKWSLRDHHCGFWDSHVMNYLLHSPTVWQPQYLWNISSMNMSAFHYSINWFCFCSLVSVGISAPPSRLSPAAFACIADLSGLVLELGAALLAALLHSEFRLTRVPTLSVPSVPMSYLDWMSEWKESVPRAAASSRKDDFELSPSWSPQICVNVPLWYLMNSPLISSLLEMKRFFLLFA